MSNRLRKRKIEYNPEYVFKAREGGQTEYYRAITENDITFAIGPSGTGKSACAIAAAINDLCNHKVERIILTRPTVGVDEDGRDKGIGFLPGSLRQKMDPYMRPLFDEISKYFDKTFVEQLIYDEIIEICPLYYCRGRTFNDTFVIVDEAQNMSHGQIKAITTRMGFGSKMVINGDIEQYDIRKKVCPLETWVDEILDGEHGIAVVELDDNDIVRHPVVRRILGKIDAYEQSHGKLV